MTVAGTAGGRAPGVLALEIDDPRYPAALRDLPDAPAVLYVAGSPGALRCGSSATPAATVAVVGSRAASPYGLDVAAALGRGLAVAEVVVISGMAHGIDAAAHRAVLDAGGVTVAVAAGDAEHAHPPSARALHARIRTQGAVVSEVPPGSRPRRWSFPRRNRLIAALADTTVVVEAAAGSGALITAAIARRLGRKLGAVPGRVTSPLSAGANDLIAGGAQLVTGPEDVLAMLGIAPESGARVGTGTGTGGAGGRRRRGGLRAPAGLTGAEEALWRALAEGHGLDAAITRAGLPAERGMAALAALELGGAISRSAGGSWTVCAG